MTPAPGSGTVELRQTVHERVHIELVRVHPGRCRRNRSRPPQTVHALVQHPVSRREQVRPATSQSSISHPSRRQRLLSQKSPLIAQHAQGVNRLTRQPLQLPRLINAGRRRRKHRNRRLPSLPRLIGLFPRPLPLRAHPTPAPSPVTTRPMLPSHRDHSPGALPSPNRRGVKR